MGNYSCCTKPMKGNIVLLLIGLDNAGKTVTAKGLAGEPVNCVAPTVGFSVIRLNYLRYDIKVFDLGGGPSIRGIWSQYFADTHGIIFVVDASDLTRLDEAKEALEQVLSHEKISGKPVLLLANKQDSENALDEIDLLEKLELELLVNSKQCPTLVETCSATETTSKSKVDPGIKAGYDWLVKYIIRNYDEVNSRVQQDLLEQEIVNRQLLQEKIERVRLNKEIEMSKDDNVIELYSEYQKKNGNGENPADPMSGASRSVQTDATLPERPKSATQLVRRQLELNGLAHKAPKIKPTNRVAPLSVYNNSNEASRSAQLRRKQYTDQRRTLKSAGDSVFVHSELFQMGSVATGPNGDSVQSRDVLTIERQYSSDARFNRKKSVVSNEYQNGEAQGLAIIYVD